MGAPTVIKSISVAAIVISAWAGWIAWSAWRTSSAVASMAKAVRMDRDYQNAYSSITESRARELHQMNASIQARNAELAELRTFNREAISFQESNVATASNELRNARASMVNSGSIRRSLEAANLRELVANLAKEESRLSVRIASSAASEKRLLTEIANAESYRSERVMYWQTNSPAAAARLLLNAREGSGPTASDR